jgi:hypothetical protein
LGQQIPFQLSSESTHRIKMQLRDARAGIYLVQLDAGGKKYTTKISVVP